MKLVKTKNKEVAKIIEAKGYNPIQEVINGETYFSYPISDEDMLAITSAIGQRFSEGEYMFSQKLHF